MGLVERLFGRAEVPPAPVQPGGQVYATAVPYLDGTTAVGLSAVFRSVTLIADAIAAMPWRELKGPEDAPVDLAPSRLVRRPLASMTRREWTWRVVATEALWNSCHVLYVGGYDTEGVPWSLLPIPPAAVSPADALTDPWGLLPPRRYMVGGDFVEASQLTVIRRAPFPGIPDHLAGVLTLARRSFTAYLAAETHQARYWQRGGPVIDVLKTDQELTDPEAEAIGQRWANRRARGADFPAVLGKGADAKPYGSDPTTDSASKARADMVADVGRYFGMPTRLLNAPLAQGATETYANLEDESVDLLRYTLAGYMGPLEDAISELLPGDYQTGRRMRLDPLRLTQGNLESRARAWSSLTGAPIVEVDEARRLGFGLGPREIHTAPVAGVPDALPAAFAGLAGATTPQEAPA